MDRNAPPGPAWTGGFTLPELLVTLAIAALLVTQAVPALQALLARHRLDQAVSETRSQLLLAERRARLQRQALRIDVRAGPNWRIGCQAGAAPPPCVTARRHPRVRLTSVRPANGRLRFDGVRGLAAPARLVFASGPLRQELRIALSGRLRICDPEEGTC